MTAQNELNRLEAAKHKIIAVTIKHYFEAPCVADMPRGFECRLCTAVKEFEDLLGRQTLEAFIEQVGL